MAGLTKTLWQGGALASMAVAAVSMSSLSWAHGPTRQKVSESVEINAPAAKVWSVIGNFQDMNWADGVAKTTGKGGNAVNATRTLTLTSGATIDQDCTFYDAATMTYGYFTDKVDVKVLPVNDYSGRISVTADGADKSKVSWEAAFYRGFMNNDPPPELSDDAALKAVTKTVRASLDGLKQKVEAAH